jgi:hypothetical protein
MRNICRVLEVPIENIVSYFFASWLWKTQVYIVCHPQIETSIGKRGRIMEIIGLSCCILGVLLLVISIVILICSGRGINIAQTICLCLGEVFSWAGVFTLLYTIIWYICYIEYQWLYFTFVVAILNWQD